MMTEKSAAPKIEIIDIKKIDPPECTMRQTFVPQEMTDLAESILKVGILQPIVVTPNKDRYTIVAGHRRYIAAQQATLKEIPCIVRRMNPADAAIATIHENLYRRDITPLEKAAYYIYLMKRYNWTVADVAAKVGVSYQVVNDHINLMKADEQTINALKDNLITFSHAKALLREKNVQIRQYYLRNCVDSGANVFTVNKWVTDGILERLPPVAPAGTPTPVDIGNGAARTGTSDVPHVNPSSNPGPEPPQDQQPIFCAICKNDIPAGKEIILALCQTCYNKIYGPEEAKPDQKGKKDEPTQSKTDAPST